MDGTYETTSGCSWSVDGQKFKLKSSGDGNTASFQALEIGTDYIVCEWGGVTGQTKAYVINDYVGKCVEYDVEYEDMYTEQHYTSTTGWRYLGEDDSGNKMLISTGTPLVMYLSNQEEDGTAEWWGSR